jgi:hypothetical protein
MRCPETICWESPNPEIQGSIPCASTNMLCPRRLQIYMLESICCGAARARANHCATAGGPQTITSEAIGDRLIAAPRAPAFSGVETVLFRVDNTSRPA